MKRRFGALLVLLLLVSAAGDLIASELPVEIFFRDFEFTDMKISPDGKYLVAIAPYKTRRNLIAIDMARRKPQWLTRFGDRHVYAFEWVSNERLILQMEEGGMDTGGLFAINRDASNDRVLVDTIHGQAQGVVTGLRMVAPLSSLAEDSENILVETTEVDKFSTAPSRSFTHVDRMNVMTGLTQTPELYKCGVNYAGVTDLGSWLRGIRVRSSRTASVEAGYLVGDYKQDPESLDAQSPLKHVEKIQAPVFLAYGGQVPRVHLAQGRRLARALKSHDKKFVMVVEEQEGHGFHIEDNRVNLFKKIDAFLKENLSRR